MRKYLLNCKLVWAVALWTAFVSIPPSSVHAFPSESLAILQPVSLREAQIDKVMSVLSRPEARLHMRLMRIDESQVRDSLAKLDDAELAQVAERADSVKAAGGALGIVIALLVIVLLVVLIMNISDKKIEIKDDK